MMTINKDCREDIDEVFQLKNDGCNMGNLATDYNVESETQYNFKVLPSEENENAFKIYNTNCSSYIQVADPS